MMNLGILSLFANLAYHHREEGRNEGRKEGRKDPKKFFKFA